MLGSLPPVVPRDAFSLWSPTSSTSTHDSHAHQHPTQGNHQQQQQQQQQQRRSHAVSVKNTLHAQLQREEELISSRKSNVQRFGATWLRPPGVSKTYQAMMDEELERIEAHMIATREAERREMEAAAEEDARAAMGDQTDEQTGGVIEDMEGMQRDLDDDVPDAESSGGMELDDGDDEDEDAFVEPDADDGLEGDRDLDDDVPEAGSYQHTDTEVEDLSSDDERSSPRHPEQEAEEQITPASGQRRPAWSASPSAPQVIQNFQVPLPMPPTTLTHVYSTPSEPAADSSLVMSSPIATRPAARAAQASTPSSTARRSVRYASRRGENRPSG